MEIPLITQPQLPYFRWDSTEYRRRYSKAWIFINKERKNEQARIYYLKHPEYRHRQIEKNRRRALLLKIEVFTHYSGGTPKCACCGETIIQFLSIDHLLSGGSAHRATIKRSGGEQFYYWLKKNGYPGGYGVLCYNCNCAKGFFGGCPHQSWKQDVTEE